MYRAGPGTRVFLSQIPILGVLFPYCLIVDDQKSSGKAREGKRELRVCEAVRGRKPAHRKVPTISEKAARDV